MRLAKNKPILFLIYFPVLIISLLFSMAGDIIAPSIVDNARHGLNRFDLQFPKPAFSIGILPFVASIIWIQAMILLTIVLCIRFYLRAKNLQIKKQLKLITLGIGIHLFAGALNIGIFPILFHIHVPELNPISKALMALMIGYGIRKYELFKPILPLAADNILKTMSDAMVLFNQQHSIVAVNNSLLNLLEYKEAELIQQPVQKIFKEKRFFENFFQNLSQTETQGNYDLNFCSKSGQSIPIIFSTSTIRDNTGNIISVIGIAKDISERKQEEEKIYYLAYYDQLTHLPNRTLFFDHLKIALATAKRHERYCAIMFLDIDNFKHINDSLGHDLGDMLIKKVAERLQQCIRKEDTISRDQLPTMLDTVARLGGDEFTILLSEIHSPENASQVAERIHRSLLPPFALENNKVNITVSIGIAIYPLDGTDMETLLKNADFAMYNAKAQGKNSYQFFTSSLTATTSLKSDLEKELSRAIENNEFVLYYQPVLDLKTKKMCGVEGLLRWMHPKQGILPAKNFMPLAEETGLIISLGNWVFATITACYSQWRKDGLPEIGININISPKELKQTNLLDTISSLLTVAKISPEQLTIEINESSALHNFEETNKTISSLKALGVKVALDNFGSGYISIQNLKQLKIDILKLDYSLIKNIHRNSQDAAIVSSLVTIGHSLNLQMSAVGIEEENQLYLLEEKNCNLGQGYYLSQPLTETELIKFWKNEKV